jgi:mono/diheme cytochrome c family protein
LFFNCVTIVQVEPILSFGKIFISEIARMNIILLVFKKLMKLAGILLAVVIMIIILVVGYIWFFLPNVRPAPIMNISITKDRVKRGEYLANHVMACMGCHSKTNWDKAGAPIEKGTLGMGGDKFIQDSLGFFGDLYFPNITPFALSSWTDGEIFRAITTGVDNHGSGLITIMPFRYYGQLDSADIQDVIAYLRTLPAVNNNVPKPRNGFLFKLVNKIVIKDAVLSRRPETSDTIAYGKYLATAGACVECHSPFKGPFPKDPNTMFSGGPVYTMSAHRIQAGNITPDIETGIGRWSKQQFIDHFKVFADTSVVGTPIDPKKDFTSIMPWVHFSGMNDTDLGAIYSYLRTIKPVKNEVQKIVPYPTITKGR